MEQTSSLFQKISFLNCSLNKQQHNDNLVDSVILVPSASASATVQSDMTDGSISDRPRFVCLGAIQEWMKESQHRKEARETRQKASTIKNLREATRRNGALVSILPVDSTKNETTFEHDGIVFATNDTAINPLSAPVYSKSLF
eukprot:scaffold16630_cov177-Amphora_coffeaeformis.AAC.5